MTLKTTALSLIVILVGMRSATQAQQNFALLVGVNQYRHHALNKPNPLRYPEQDVQDVKKILERSGYKVVTILGEGATKETVLSALGQCGKRGEYGGVLLLGFFGHGVQYGDRAFFCPYDAGMNVLRDDKGRVLKDKNGQDKLGPDKDTLVPMREILEPLKVSGASCKLLLADCCRNDPAAARGANGRGIGQQQARAFGDAMGNAVALPLNTTCLFACTGGQKAWEDEAWENGAFTEAFIETCDSGEALDPLTLASKMRRRVKALAASIGEQQTMNVRTNLEDDIDLAIKPIAGRKQGDGGMPIQPESFEFLKLKELEEQLGQGVSAFRSTGANTPMDQLDQLASNVDSRVRIRALEIRIRVYKKRQNAGDIDRAIKDSAKLDRDLELEFKVENYQVSLLTQPVATSRRIGNPLKRGDLIEVESSLKKSGMWLKVVSINGKRASGYLRLGDVCDFPDGFNVQPPPDFGLSNPNRTKARIAFEKMWRRQVDMVQLGLGNQEFLDAFNDLLAVCRAPGLSHQYKMAFEKWYNAL